MKRLMLLAVFAGLNVCLMAGGEQEKADPGTAPAAAVNPVMEEIVYLSVENHDNPEIQPLWAEEFKRISGVDVILQTVSSKDAGDLMMTKFIAGEIPDVVKYGSDNIEPLARQGFIVPLNGLIDDSPGMKKLADTFASSFAAHSLNCEIYGIPALTGSQRGLWVRTDILDELGLEIPSDIDEFVDVLKAIRDNYPAPDGSPMYPYISKTYHQGYMSILSNYFDVQAGSAVKRPNETEYRDGWDSPQFREYAEFMRMMWDEKLIDPDHALPQKASKTRSKFYAGEGAFLAMWTDRYPSMIAELRENFPQAEITLVTPFDNPRGGTLGMSVVPGYRPFCITSEAADARFVFENFIEVLYLTQEGALLQNRGIPGVNYKVVDGTFVDNHEESGVHMKTRPIFNPDINVPYRLPELTQIGVDQESRFSRWFAGNSNYAVMESPDFSVPSYDMISGDLGDKKQELFWKYVIGEIEFDSLMDQYEKYKGEIGYGDILKEINSH